MMAKYTDQREVIKKLHKLTTKYYSLEDALWNACAFANIMREIEELCTEMCCINTTLSTEQLDAFLDNHYCRS